MELSIIWVTLIPMASLNPNPKNRSRGTSTVPPPIPKKPEQNPTKMPIIIAVIKKGPFLIKLYQRRIDV